MIKNKIKQHYIPQFYLRLFSPKEKGHYVYCYDKATKKSFRTSTRQVCYENGFYEDKNKPIKPIEDAFSICEKESSALFRKVIKAEDLRVFTAIELAMFLGFLLLFKQRTKKRRGIVAQARKIWLDRVNSQFSDWKIAPKSSNWQQADHLLSMVDLLEEETRQLFENNWVLLVNQTKTPFWTSDDPLVQQLISNDVRFKEPYVKYYFPLSPHLLIFSEPLTGNYLRLYKAVTADEDAVNNTNHRLTLRNAHRFVISPENNFLFSNP